MISDWVQERTFFFTVKLETFKGRAMTFDWFRRRYDNPEEPKSAETEPTQTEPETPEKPATDASEDYLNWAKVAYENIRKRQEAEAQKVAQELDQTGLQGMGQAADQDLAPEIAQATVEAPIETLIEAPPEGPSEVPIEEQTASAIAAKPEPITPIDQPDSDTSLETVEPVATQEILQPSDELVASDQFATSDQLAASDELPSGKEVPETVALPFWAVAEAERQARLDQLRETAIVEPEPEIPVARPSSTPTISISPTSSPTTATPTPAAPVIPDFLLDEGFLWSTEILAAQGRRPDEVSLEEITWLKRLRQGLDKTRRGLVNQLRSIVGQGPLNQDAVLEIESALLQADVGVAATDIIIDSLQNKMRNETLPPDAAISYLKQILRDMLDSPLEEYGNITFAPQKDTLNIWLMTGVNGAGKTTTIGKLAHIAQKSGYKCLIAAADTFRAAAVEQVKVWGTRSGVEVIANPGKNTDPAAVVFDAITAAKSRQADLLLVDTAGRLQNKKNLMDELSKVRRIIDKKAPDAVVESLLVLDSTLGQNGLRQAEVFSEAAKLSGVVLTKLDGTAKGGIALAVVQQLGLPIRFIGAGEGIEDLRPFSSYEFVEALLNG
jgi:fused signal recognition particle receptor